MQGADYFHPKNDDLLLEAQLRKSALSRLGVGYIYPGFALRLEFDGKYLDAAGCEVIGFIDIHVRDFISGIREQHQVISALQWRTLRFADGLRNQTSHISAMGYGETNATRDGAIQLVAHPVPGSDGEILQKL